MRFSQCYFTAKVLQRLGAEARNGQPQLLLVPLQIMKKGPFQAAFACLNVRVGSSMSTA